MHRKRSAEKTARPRPRTLRALGRNDPPLVIETKGEFFERRNIFKHDSMAATALYESVKRQGQLIICKFNRQQPIAGIPMKWLGRRLARRERRVLETMADVATIPDSSGDVFVDGSVDRTAAAHEFVPGHPLAYREQVGDEFFAELTESLRTLHARDIAYVDLNKRENIIVGDDGRPHLIDFQISFTLPRWWPGRSAPARQVLRLLQSCDHYHLRKHISKHRPDLLPPQELASVGKLPWPIRIHRSLAVPARELRRRLLVLIGVRTGKGRSSSEVDPEDAVRRSLRQGRVLRESRRID